MLTVIIVNYNNSLQVKDYVSRIKNFKIIDKIILVDNDSSDNSVLELKEITDTKIDLLCAEKNGGYGFGNNIGIRYAKEKYNADFALISNADVYYDEKFLIGLLCAIEREKSSVVAGVMKLPDGPSFYPWKVTSGWRYVFSCCTGINRFINCKYKKSYLISSDKALDVDYVPGSLLLINVSDFIEIGGYDESIFLYCEEMVLGIRLKSHGKRTLLLPAHSYIHDHPRSKKQKLEQIEMMWESRKIVLTKYYSFSAFKMLFVNIIEKLNLLIFKLNKIKEIYMIYTVKTNGGGYSCKVISPCYLAREAA